MTRSVRIALIDSGVDRRVASIGPHVEAAWRVDRDGQAHEATSPTNDLYGHGTRMAGVIVANAPKATIVDVGVLDKDNGCTLAMLARGIAHATRSGVDILCLPLASLARESEDVTTAIEDAIAQGILVVAACRNGAAPLDSYPACLPGVIGVARVPLNRRPGWAPLRRSPLTLGVECAPFRTWSREGRPIEVWGNSAAAARITALCANIIRGRSRSALSAAVAALEAGGPLDS